MSLDHNRTDVVTHENEFGHPQTYQVDGFSKVPVCGTCGILVRPNTGQGCDCEKCQHEAFLEMEKDYDEGGHW